MTKRSGVRCDHTPGRHRAPGRRLGACQMPGKHPAPSDRSGHGALNSLVVEAPYRAIGRAIPTQRPYLRTTAVERSMAMVSLSSVMSNRGAGMLS